MPSSRPSSPLGAVTMVWTAALLLIAGCQCVPPEREATDVDLDQLRQQIEQEQEVIQNEYGQARQTTPSDVREMAEHMQAMLAQIRQMEQGRDATEVIVTTSDTTARATREWHERMSALHEAEALLQQDETLAARQRRLMRLHRQLMQLLPPAAAPDVPDMAATQNPAGAALYVPYCVACHGREGEGAAGIFPPLAGSKFVTGNAADLIRITLHGLEGPITVQGETYEGSMPPFGPRLTDEEVAAILTYIRSAWGNDADSVSPAEVEAIREEHAGRTRPWTAASLREHDVE